MESLNFSTDLTTERLNIQGIRKLIPDGDIFKNIDFEIISANARVNWTLTPRLNPRSAYVEAIDRSIERITGNVEWKIHTEDCSRKQLEFLLNEKYTRDLGDIIVGVLTFDISNSDFHFETKDWLFDPRTGSLQIIQCEIIFDENYAEVY